MLSFDLPDHTPTVTVHLVEDLTKEQLLAFPAFQRWLSTLNSSLARQKYSDHAFHEHPYILRKITIQSIDWFGPPGSKLGFVKLKAEVKSDPSEKCEVCREYEAEQDEQIKKIKKCDKVGMLPGVVFLRGGSVAVLMIVRPRDARDERWVIMTEQPRIPAGSLSFMEIPAGMMDDTTRTFAGVAAKEIKEEVGLTLREDELVDMTRLAVQGHKSPENLANAMYPSPGGCDEYIAIFLWEKEMDRLEIENLKDKLMGERTEQEKITVRLLNYERLLEVGGRDAKTLAAWSLYEYLKRTREIS